jgi:hypothetical protein
MGEGRIDLAPIAQQVVPRFGRRVGTGGSALQELLELAHIGLGGAGEVGVALDALAHFVIGALAGQRVDAAGEDIALARLIAGPGFAQGRIVDGAGDLLAEAG